jgi:adenylylsulfate kinase
MGPSSDPNLLARPFAPGTIAFVSHGDAARAVLITGVFGSGKSSVAAEMADILERRDVRYALLDLDYLAWGYPGSGRREAEHRMMLKNLQAVTANYVDAGVRSFVLARSIRSRSELDSLRSALGMPLTTVRLTLPVREIQRRLSADVTSARRDDLREAAAWIAAAHGVGIEDATVSNEGSIPDVASSILERLGWT